MAIRDSYLLSASAVAPHSSATLKQQNSKLIPERGPQTAKRELERERPHGTTGPRDHGTKLDHRRNLIHVSMCV